MVRRGLHNRPQARVIHVSLMAYVAYIDYVTS